MFIIRPDLNTTEIERRIDDLSLFKYYTDNFRKVNTKFKSEFRRDKNPSASITEYNGKLWYKDFGDPLQTRAYNIYDFVMRKYNLNFIDALHKINSDFKLGLGTSKDKISPIIYQITNNSKKYNNKNTNDLISTIRVRKIELNDEHIKFWNQYKIKKWDIPIMLNKHNIYPISHFWLQNTVNIKNKMYVVNDLGFTYDEFWHKGILLRKIYLPKKTGSMFFTNCNTLVTQGYEQLPEKGDLLFITSSKKDLVILDYLGYPAVAPSNENVFIPEYRYEELKDRFKNIVLFYDNDFDKDENWGKLFSEKYSKKYDIPYILLPDNSKKDPSDFIKHYGSKELNDVIHEKLKDVGIRY